MSSGLQNRVRPDGAIIADPARGRLMGNRGGRIHKGKTVVRRWASKQWIYCVLDFKNRHREVMGDGYTELFFFDEAVALAAGHRPCFECQRERAMEFAQAFPSEGRSRAPDMDRQLHNERLGPRDRLLVSDLPNGSFIEIEGNACLLHDGLVRPWTMQGYGAAQTPPKIPVTVLTPRSTRATLSAGYVPYLHPDLCG